jgi:uncharacterized protein
MDAATERAVRISLSRLDGKYPVVECILYGSRARSTHRTKSDAEIAVVPHGPRGDRPPAARDRAGIAFDIMPETAVLVDASPLRRGEIQNPERFSNPALEHDRVRLTRSCSRVFDFRA